MNKLPHTPCAPKLGSLCLLTGSALLFSVHSVAGAVLFKESFDYGINNIPDMDNTLANYSGGTSTIDYVAGSSLAGLGGESGGHLYYNFATADATRQVTNTAADFNPFPDAEGGATFWMAGIIEYNTVGSVEIRFDNGQTVNDWGFGMDASGNVMLIGSDGGAVANPLDTGLDASAGNTYVFLSRATLGAGTSPTASTIDFWLNPTLTSVATLGTPDFTTGADSKIGRDTGAYTDLIFTLGGSPSVRVDEIRLGTDFSDVSAIPEPSTYAMIGGLLTLGMVALRRRRR